MKFSSVKGNQKEGKEFKRVLPKKGYHKAILKIIADLGTVKSNNPEYEDRRMMMWIWELPNLAKKEGKGWRPTYVQQRIPFNPKSKILKALLKEWLGYTPGEIAKLDVQELLDQPAEINIAHSKDGKYANVKDVQEPQGKTPEGVMDPLCVVLDKKEFSMEDFEALPEWIQNLMIESDEFAEVTGERRRGKRSDEDYDDKSSKRKPARGNSRRR